MCDMLLSVCMCCVCSVLLNVLFVSCVLSGWPYGCCAATIINYYYHYLHHRIYVFDWEKTSGKRI
jgi:hypothetical protein